MHVVGTPVMDRRRMQADLDDDGCATLVDVVSGERWLRWPAGRWVQMSPVPAGTVLEVARLMAHPDTRGGDVAEVLRASPASWLGTLRMALHLARGVLGVTGARARSVLELATSVMTSSESLPHHVVAVVDNPAALAAAYRVDAVLAARHVEAVALRYSAQAAEHQGAVRVPVSDAGQRHELLAELARRQRESRPGLHYLVEPVTRGEA